MSIKMAEEKKKAKEQMKCELNIPQGVELKADHNLVEVKGGKGTLSRNFANPLITIKKKDDKVELTVKNANKKNKRILHTIRSHILNMLFGVQESFVYKLKICSGHFPMTIKHEGDKIVIINFLGEKIPRTSLILPDVKVDLGKDIITLEGINCESVGQTAANLEVATKIKNRDRRIFQDGIHLIEKGRRK